MRYRRNANGKIILKDRNGKEVAFQFSVDVNEALRAKGVNGECPYTIPKSSVIGIAEEMAEDKAKKNINNRKKIKTTSGENIPDEFFEDEDPLDENFVGVDPSKDNFEDDEKALDKLGLEDLNEEAAVPVADAPKARGRKPSVKE
jgi:hypothetical protein